MRRPHLLIGLTGGIGSGKSTVADLFAAQGVRVIDTDAVSHQLTAAGGAAMAAIRSEFGSEYITSKGALDRAKMRQRIFERNSDAKARLEHILHPLILSQIRQSVTLPTCAPYSLIVVPLLFENQPAYAWLDRSLLVDCQETAQIQRTMARSRLSAGEVEAIMSHQLSRAERLKRANDIIENNGDKTELALQVGHLHSEYMTRAKGID